MTSLTLVPVPPVAQLEGEPALRKNSRAEQYHAGHSRP